MATPKLLALPLAAALALLPSPVPGADAPARDRGELVVMTYNLRYASAIPPHSWPQRRPLVADRIRAADPDVIGTQEGVYAQLRDLADDLPEYDWIGLGREGGSHGEFCAIFYRKDRLEPLEYDHFWLSDDPGRIGSRSFGNEVIRMATWVRFLDRRTGARFFVVNTHFDHESREARERSAELVRERAEALVRRRPTLLIGDFNARAGSAEPWRILVERGPFRDTWETAKERGEQVGTFHGYGPPRPEAGRIDWILASRGIRALEASIDRTRAAQRASDHFPVVATVRVARDR